jgi:hypothetical protein
MEHVNNTPNLQDAYEALERPSGRRQNGVQRRPRPGEAGAMCDAFIVAI